jgi:hypothetical protein
MSPLLMKTDTDVIDDLFVNDLEETSPEVLTVADAAGLTSKVSDHLLLIRIKTVFRN